MPASRPRLHRKLHGLAVAGAALILLCVLALALPGVFERVENAASDLRLRLVPRPHASEDVVFVDIDDASVRLAGKWPLKRSIHAKVLDILTECGVSAVAYDVVFHGPTDPAEDAALEAALKRSGRAVLPAGVSLVREADVVRLSPDEEDLMLLPSLLAPGTVRVQSLPQTEKSFLPAAGLSRQAAAMGHIAATPDADGVYRTMPLFVGYHGRLLPSLALATAMRHLGGSVTPAPGGAELVWPKGRLFIPTTPGGLMPVNFAAPWGSGYWHLSYAELIESAQDPARMAFLKQGLAGRVAVVGLAASGTTDIKATPLSPAEPLVTLHANLLSSLLTGALITPAPAWASGLFGAFFLAAAVLLYLRLSIRAFLAAGLGLIALLPVANVSIFALFALALNLSGALLALGVAVLALLAHGLARTAADSARQRRMLEAYFSPAIARQILESGADIMEGRSVDITVLFSDIAGFTHMSDHMDPAEVQLFLGEYLEEMTACVFRNGGAVDKFMGDGLMAFFGYPEAEGVDSSENARLSALAGVRAGVEMQAALQRLNRRWAEQGRQKVTIRIGLNTGHAIVGDMGSTSRREFTLLGRNVNLAQRLESNCPCGGVLLSQRTAALVQEQYRVNPVGALKLKGFDQEVECFVVDIPGPEQAQKPPADCATS